ERLKTTYHLAYDSTCMHEFVLSAETMKEEFGVTALDIAKALLDRGIHPMTIYFPLIVHEAMMIEPTETESKQTLDHFVDVMLEIYKKAAENPEELKSAPVFTPVKRIDEVQAAKQPVLRWISE
ncbi:MAG: aminomethyl-transferring glycine dehydrogenase subunit GcvPB, partial [Spirochaetes bacterium]